MWVRVARMPGRDIMDPGEYGGDALSIRTHDDVTTWLREHVGARRKADRIFGALAIPGGLILMAVTALVFGFLLTAIPLHYGWRADPATVITRASIAAAVVLGLAGLRAWRRPSVDLQLKPMPDWRPVQTGLYFGDTPTRSGGVRGGSMGRAVDNITESVLCGPHLTRHGFRRLARARRLSRLDTVSCAAVIAVLRDAGGRVAYGDIAKRIADLDPETTVGQLRDIDGVMFRTSDPAGLALDSHLGRAFDARDAGGYASS